VDDEARHDAERQELLAAAYGRGTTEDGAEARAARARLAALDGGSAAPAPVHMVGPPSRRRLAVLLAATAIVAFGLGAVVVAAVSPRPAVGGTETTAATATTAAPPSVLSRALRRPQLPVDVVPRSLGDDVEQTSSRLLYDDDPTLVSAGHRWRVWVGTGENAAQLCLVATFDNATHQTSCFPRADAFDGRFILRARTTSGDLEVLVVDGAVAVQIT
jgi:hypothetical protein